MMAPVASLVLLSFAVSLDGFGVGITYGVRKIKIPVSSILIISACSGLIILLSMMVGVALTGWMSPDGASAVGAVILIGIGTVALIQFIRNGGRDEAKQSTAQDVASEEVIVIGNEPAPVLKMELKVFGFIIQILRTPSAADMDLSGTISAGEAFFLGTALSLDAFGAGIGAALVGFPPLLTAILIAAASGLFLWSGTRVGFWVSGWRWVRQLSMLPGIILIVMGIFKLLV
ncbi:sporulation membrane protein YtaF [Cohnella abietis]|uniref:Sporulation membrane protein YtaF n=1 Tax=Cohnella abietis TaxID=2507935 RepID=A0A3T1DA05_9BACL|nr:sporulation membrane protein YtaF [Cohnella abietis]BBI34921.1 sporulation membrane protein YtaF [Cohnella abietis]